MQQLNKLSGSFFSFQITSTTIVYIYIQSSVIERVLALPRIHQIGASEEDQTWITRPISLVSPPVRLDTGTRFARILVALCRDAFNAPIGERQVYLSSKTLHYHGWLAPKHCMHTARCTAPAVLSVLASCQASYCPRPSSHKLFLALLFIFFIKFVLLGGSIFFLSRQVALFGKASLRTAWPKKSEMASSFQ